MIVHLLNRRRFHVVQWAAMDFLREALTRSRRMMELRDLLLLLLRVACLLAFGMALARPYWNRFSQAAVDPNQPVHAVVLVDNSLSMSYQKPDGILLDDAKAKAKEWIEGLPSGSVISVLPTCGSASGVNFEAYSRREDALEALAAIRPVDCAARSGQVIDRALEACRRTTSMAGRRIFLVTDQQVANWSADAETGTPQAVALPDASRAGGRPTRSRTSGWTTCSFATAWPTPNVRRYSSPRSATRAASRAKAFPWCSRSMAGRSPRKPSICCRGRCARSSSPSTNFHRIVRGPAQTRYATVEVSIAKDKSPSTACRRTTSGRSWCRWPTRFRWSSSIPWGPTKTRRRRFSATPAGCGDGWPRRSGRPGQDRPLVQVRHLTIDQLTRKALADARLVVIGGVSRPSPEEVSLLKQYVEQGGNLLLAAGGSFDPAAWTEAAWQDGLGILPAPLAPTAQGYVRDDRRWATSKTAPLTLKFASLPTHYFRPEGVSDDYLREALGPPTFFHKIVVAQCDKAVQDRVAEAAAKYFGEQREKLADIDRQLAALETAANAGNSQQKIADLRSGAGKTATLVADLEEGRRQGRRRAIAGRRLGPAGPARGPGTLQQRPADARAAAVGARAGPLPDDEPFARVDDAARFAAVGLADGPHRPLRVVRDADRLERQQREGAGPAGRRRRARGPIHARRSRGQAAGLERRCPGRRSLRHRPE